MRTAPEKIVILMADDDEADIRLARKVFERSAICSEFRWVTDGDSLMDYLRRRGEYSDAEKSPRPGVILLDLNMPGKDGREALREIKSDPELRRIPVVVQTTSRAPQDIVGSYDSGANAFMTKPATFDGLRESLTAFERYWVEIATLP
jgi:CheY-like chemotaxis protein